MFDAETLGRICAGIAPDVAVVLYVADGLSSSAVTANAADILPVIRKGLEGAGVKVNEPFFVRFGRVATMDQIGDGLPAEVVCVLLGERPGLVTAESMSAYIAYKPRWAWRKAAAPCWPTFTGAARPRWRRARISWI